MVNPKYLEPSPPNRYRWMVSYLDVVTILLIFFLAAAARGIGHTAAASPPPPPPAPSRPASPDPPAPSRAALLRAQEAFERQGLDPRMESDGLVISLPQVAVFPSAEDTVDPQALPMLAQIADVLRELPDNNVQLIGHADTVPIHNRRFRSNWELSLARSLSILNVLTTRYGLPESRLSIAGYSSYRPTAANDTAPGRASNRRVEILILDNTAPTR